MLLLVDRVFDTFSFVILLEWLVFLFVSAVGDLFCFHFLMTSAHTQMIFYLFFFDLLLLLFVLLDLCSVHFSFFCECFRVLRFFFLPKEQTTKKSL